LLRGEARKGEVEVEVEVEGREQDEQVNGFVPDPEEFSRQGGT
jgi:hypothetical protein